MDGKNIKTLPAFLKFHSIKKGNNPDNKQSTHTRIGGKDRNGELIYGGNYSIDATDLPEFYKLYHKHVFINGHNEYLTETQDIINGGTLFVDIDMRFDETITTRQFELDDITSIIELYCESFKEIFKFTKKTEFPVYLFEKDNVVLQEGKETKDGLHIAFGLQMKHDIQQLVRTVVIQKEKNEMHLFGENGLNCVNTPEDIFDECISIGRNNWQVWGSRKPGCEAYELKYKFVVTFMPDDEPYSLDMVSIDDINIKNLLPIISTKNKTFEKLTEVYDKHKGIIEKMKIKKKTKVNKKKQRGKLTNIGVVGNFPTNAKELDEFIDETITNLSLKDYHLKVIHDFTLLLNEAYYEPFKSWMEVGWALHNTSNDMFWTWVKFSSKGSKFDWDSIPTMHKQWNDMKDEGFTFRSIHFWAKGVNPTEYKKIYDNSIEQLVYKTLPGGGNDTDIAILAKNLFMGEFACVSMVEKKWYQFLGHKWKESDAGIGLRIKLSQEVEALYQQAAQNEKDKSTDEEYTAGEREGFLQNASAFNRITIKLKTHCQKKSIMGECQEQFYNEEMLSKMDENKYLLGFKNGVYDFKQKCFRRGLPEDYVSFSTNTNYIPYDKNDKEQLKIKDEIDDFMEKVFPNPQLRQYMWDHAASTLIGDNINQKFIIYTGVGGNGKSIWVDIINLALGDYADKINIALLTQKRKSIGGPSPEIAKLKGRRFVSMDEPSAGDELNEGIMKQMTGGDEMEGRNMYAKKMCKFTPQFELTCCTNHLFAIKSTDKGTWRRIRQVPFDSEFLDIEDYNIKERQGLVGDTDRPIYIKDLKLKEKLPKWIQVFTAIIIERVNKTGGIVKDCPMVLAASKKYEERENFWRQFINENIVKGEPNDRIKKTEIRNHFNEWYQINYQQKPPKATDLYEQLEKNIGKQRNRAWYGYKIVYESYDSEDDEDNHSD
jgi:P4 family phage/plasmid primase-like protien